MSDLDNLERYALGVTSKSFFPAICLRFHHPNSLMLSALVTCIFVVCLIFEIFEGALKWSEELEGSYCAT